VTSSILTGFLLLRFVKAGNSLDPIPVLVDIGYIVSTTLRRLRLLTTDHLHIPVYRAYKTTLVIAVVPYNYRGTGTILPQAFS
jgi:hypothetical protein